MKSVNIILVNNMDLFDVRNSLINGKNIYDISLKVTFYARVSTDRDEQINSLENQIMYFNNFILSQSNWTFVPGYIDEGISGSSVKRRESFLGMINDAKSGKFDLILTKEISRFSRNTVDSIKYTQELLNYGVGVYFMNDNINTIESDSELRLTIMSSIAQEEVRKLSERVKFGYKRSVERGIVGGSSNIYGYIKNKGRLLINEEEADTVRTIFDLYINSNIGCGKIGRLLFDSGITNNSGNCIHSSTIKSIISNPKYKGYYCANKYGTIDYRSRKRRKISKDEWIIYKDELSVPPIVSEEEWNRANYILNSRSKKYSSDDKIIYYNRYPLSKRIFCKVHDKAFIRGNYKLKGINKYFWACSNYRRYGKNGVNGCNLPIVYEDSIVNIFRKKLDSIMNNFSFISELVSILNSSLLVNEQQSIRSKHIRKLESLNANKEKLIKMRIDGDINRDEYCSYKSKIDLEIEKVNQLLMKEDINNCSLWKEFSIDRFKEEFFSKILSDSKSVLEISSVLYKKIYVNLIDDNKINISIDYYDGCETVLI